MLLTREQFRNTVLNRDGYKCVLCGAKAVDAHHIIERRLFTDGGYYLNNGASVCSECHIKCETTEISVETVRTACGITEIVLPDHLYNDAEYLYDKWGNIILSDGRRLKGELFYDESVQKALKDVRHLFTPYVKYPRTMHCPWSESVRKDDRIIKDMSAFIGKEVVVTEKLDGECTTFYTDYIHARSLSNVRHPSRDWVKNFHAQIAHMIPDGWRICGENVYAKHSIKYANLVTYFYGFSIWDSQNICCSWEDTELYFNVLGIKWPTILYSGVYDEGFIRNLHTQLDLSRQEGYVIRVAEAFSMKDFKHKVCKWVRPGHVQTEKHWLFGQRMEVNEIQ